MKVESAANRKKNVLKTLFSFSEVGVLIPLILMVSIIGIINPVFFRVSNIAILRGFSFLCYCRYWTDSCHHRSESIYPLVPWQRWEP